jgi:hypothetical protein
MYEPNEGRDLNSDGMPDEVVRVPSALTAKGDFYGYLSSAADKDFYIIDAAWGGSICVESTGGKTYDLAVYSYADLWNNTSHASAPDGKADALIYEDKTSTAKKCFSGTSVSPFRYGEFRFIVGITSHNGDYSPYWPYWITATK